MVWLLILQGVVFLVWAVLAFATLFQLRKRAADRTGHMFPGPIAFITEMQFWLADPDHARLRWALLLMTVLLLALSVLFAVVGI